MAKITFGNTLEIPRDLITIAQTTGNDILDLGYQCRDTHPYFRFNNGGNYYYTKIHPNNAYKEVNNQNVGIDVNVYEYFTLGGKFNDAYMKYKGTGTQLRNNLNYNGTNYTNSANTYIDVREYKINPWSLHKPVPYKSNSSNNNWIGDTNYTEQIGNNIIHQKYGMIWYPGNSTNNRFCDYLNTSGFKYIAPTPTNGYNYYRLRDFDGYDTNASCNLSIADRNAGGIAVNGQQIAVRLKYTDFNISNDSTSVPFKLVAQGAIDIDNTNINNYYPFVMLSKLDNNNNITNSWIRLLKIPETTGNGVVFTAKTLGQNTSNIPWVVTIYDSNIEDDITTGNYRVAFFLTRRYDNISINGNTNFNNVEWVNCFAFTGVKGPFEDVIPFPDCVGMDFYIEKFVIVPIKKTFITNSVTASSNNSITINYTLNGDTNCTEYRMECGGSYSIGNNNYIFQPVTKYLDGGTQTIVLSKTEMQAVNGNNIFPIAGTKVTLNAPVYCTGPNGEQNLYVGTVQVSGIITIIN